MRVTLLEAERIAWGASGRNAGFVVPNFAKVDPEAVVARLGPDRGAALNRFAAESADLVFDLIRRHAIACDACQSGWIQPAHSAEALARSQSRARQWQALGITPQSILREIRLARSYRRSCCCEKVKQRLCQKLARASLRGRAETAKMTRFPNTCVRLPMAGTP